MDRRQQLFNIIGPADVKAEQLIDEIIFIEEQLKELKKLPFILVSKKNPANQKTTPAAKQYKELLQQYNNCLRLLIKMTDVKSTDELDSPLRKWARERQEG